MPKKTPDIVLDEFVNRAKTYGSCSTHGAYLGPYAGAYGGYAGSSHGVIATSRPLSSPETTAKGMLPGSPIGSSLVMKGQRVWGYRAAEGDWALGEVIMLFSRPGTGAKEYKVRFKGGKETEAWVHSIRFAI